MKNWLTGTLLACCLGACEQADEGSRNIESGGPPDSPEHSPGGDGHDAGLGGDDDPFDNAEGQPTPVAMCASDAGCPDAATPPTGNPASRVDMLFVVDDSGSMKEEQAALAQQFPRMLRKLVTGDHDGDGNPEFQPVTDLHLAVVSSNLGIATPGVQGCAPGGDDGRLLHDVAVPQVTVGDAQVDCQGPYPNFLEFNEISGSPDQAAANFACVAVLGTQGCGYEQPLEAALKALWPSNDQRVRFVAQPEGSLVGHGDGVNAGFLRNRRQDGPGTLAIVVVTDEEDCSAWNHEIFTPEPLLPSGSPIAGQHQNQRCFHNPQALYPIERYLSAYRGLYSDAGGRVVFGAIAGVPVDLVDRPTLAKVNFNDPAERDAHYQGILDDPRMQEVIDPGDTSYLVASCESELGLAYPPRRLVELARRFGPDSVVQSICGDNLGPPIEIVVRQIAGPQ